MTHNELQNILSRYEKSTAIGDPIELIEDIRKDVARLVDTIYRCDPNLPRGHQRWFGCSACGLDHYQVVTVRSPYEHYFLCPQTQEKIKMKDPNDT